MRRRASLFALALGSAVLVAACEEDSTPPSLVLDVGQDVTLVPDELALLQGTDAWIDIDADFTDVASPYPVPTGVLFGPGCCTTQFDSIQVRVGGFAEPATHEIPIYVTSYDAYYQGEDTLTLRIDPVERFDIDLPLCPSSGIVWLAVRDGEAGEWEVVSPSGGGADFTVFQDRVGLALVAQNDSASTLELSLVATDALVRAGERLGDPCEESAWVEGPFSVVNRHVEVSAPTGDPAVRPDVEVVRYPDEINFEADVTVELEQASGRTVRITATPWYLHNPFITPGTVYQSDTFRVTLPDFSGLPGWDGDWALDPAVPIDWRIQVGDSEIHEGTLTP